MIFENKMKVEGGKFARLNFAVAHDAIKSVKITGDFFLYPEDALEKIEASIIGMKVPFDAVEAEKNIIRVIEAEKAELVGITPKDFAEMISECLK